MPVVYDYNQPVLSSPKISGHPNRPASSRTVSIDKQIVSVYTPEGETVECERHVANDYVRTRGYLWEKPDEGRIAAAALAREAADAPPEIVPEVEKRVEVDARALTLEALALEGLEALRTEAEELGIVVDKRWGKKRLTDRIAQAKRAAKRQAQDADK